MNAKYIGRLLKQVAIFSAYLIGSTVTSAVALEADIETLDQYLDQQESQFTDIVDGAEKNIRWHNGIEKTDIALVYIHGFSASAKEISPVTEQLADALGANAYFARLTGHARSAEAMTEGTVEKWQKDTLEAWQIGNLIGKRVVILSASTGSTLATWLAAQPFTQELAANIMISPNFGIASRLGEIVRWNWGIKLAKWVSGPYRGFTPQNELHKKYWTERYPIEALTPMIKLVDEVVEQDHLATTVPHYMIYSPDDMVIRVDRILQLAAAMKNAKVDLLAFTQATDPAQHVLAGDACSPTTTGEIVALLKDYILSLSKS